MLGDVREFRSGTVLLIVAVLAAVLQNRWHLIRPDQTWKAATVNALPTIALLTFYVTWHATRAPWRLDVGRYRKAAALQSEIECRVTQIQTIADNRRLVEASVLYDLLANHAKLLNQELHRIRKQVDKDLDKSEYEVSSYPLRTLTKRLGDGVEWRDTHRAVFVFQAAYMTHRCDAELWCGHHQPKAVFKTDVLKHSVHPTDSHTIEQVCAFLRAHEIALSTESANLKSQFDKMLAVPADTGTKEPGLR
jgi:hypothetical protein